MKCQLAFCVLVTLFAVLFVKKACCHTDYSWRDSVWTRNVYLRSVQDADRLHTRDRRQAQSYNLMWVTQCGYSENKPTDRSSLEVNATNAVALEFLDKAAKLVYRMTRFMSPVLFQKMTETISVGVFNTQEYADYFEEYNGGPDCRLSCVPEECKKYCHNNRPIALEWSYGGIRAIAVDGNVGCGANGLLDPEFGKENLLVKSLGHSILKYIVPEHMVTEINAAYVNASNSETWQDLPSVDEYLQRGTLVWFQATEKTHLQTGGMNTCNDNERCSDEWSHRENLRIKDPALFDWLNTVYNDGRSYLEGRIATCDY